MQIDVKNKFLKWFKTHRGKYWFFITMILKMIKNHCKKCQITNVKSLFFLVVAPFKDNILTNYWFQNG